MLHAADVSLASSRIFLPRTVQRRVSRLLATQRILCLGRTLVISAVVPASVHRLALVRESLRTALRIHPTAVHVTASYPASQIMSILPPLPPADTFAHWTAWVVACHTALGATPQALQDSQHAYAARSRDRR